MAASGARSGLQDFSYSGVRAGRLPGRAARDYSPGGAKPLLRPIDAPLSHRSRADRHHCPAGCTSMPVGEPMVARLEGLDPGDLFEAGLIGAAYGRAQAPVDMRRDEA